MLQLKFQELRGNNAPQRIARDKQAAEAAKTLAAAVFEKLAQLENLSEDERAALDFIKSANSQLQYSFAQCKDSEAAKAKYTHYCDFGDRRYYSIATAPTNLFELLANLATGYRLYKSARLVAKAAEKPKTLQSFVAEKRLPTGVFEAARDLFVSQYIDYLYSLQLTRGAVLVNLKASQFTEAEAEALVQEREAKAAATTGTTPVTEAATEAAVTPEAEAAATPEVEAALKAVEAAEAKAAEAEAKAAATGKPAHKAAATKAAKALEAARAALEAAEAKAEAEAKNA